MLPLSPTRIAHKPLAMSFLSVSILLFAHVSDFLCLLSKRLESKGIYGDAGICKTIEKARGNVFYDKVLSNVNCCVLYTRIILRSIIKSERAAFLKGVNSDPLSRKKPRLRSEWR